MAVPRNNLEEMYNKLNRGSGTKAPAAGAGTKTTAAALCSSGTSTSRSKPSEVTKKKSDSSMSKIPRGAAVVTEVKVEKNSAKSTKSSPASSGAQLPRAQENVATSTIAPRQAVSRLSTHNAKPSTPVSAVVAISGRKRTSDEGLKTAPRKRLMPSADVNSPSSSSNAPLADSVTSNSLEKLNAKLVKHQAKKIELLEQKMSEEDADDREMTQGMIDLVSSRIAEVTRAIAAFSNEGVASSPTPAPPRPLILPPATPAAIHALEDASQDPWETVSVVSIADTEVDDPMDLDPPEQLKVGIRNSTTAGSSRVPRQPSPSAYQQPIRRRSSTLPEPEPVLNRTVTRVVPIQAPQLALAALPSQQAIDIAEAMRDFEDIPLDELYESSPPPQTIAPPIKAVPQVVETFPWSNEIVLKLRKVFKLTGFRENQRLAINSTLAGKDVFVLMPTGGGKSLCYQLPALCNQGQTKGVTFVISPLLSLINDQVAHLIKLGIPVIALTGDNGVGDRRTAIEMLSKPQPMVKIVYTTPESLASGGNEIRRLIDTLYRNHQLARFVIDEAHCVSSWGHDFRPDYRNLGNLKAQYKGVPFMALTATANTKVRKDILENLKMNNAVTLEQSFNRPNLYYEVRPKRGGKNLILDIYGFITAQPKGSSGIIYCSSKDKCEEVAKKLRDDHQLRAYHYHAGMSRSDRIMMQTEWQEHKFEIIVATIAFGMGIDKPDVRYVIHHTLPRSLEGYYQETGRAGRDGKNAICVLFYSYGDSKSTQSFIKRDKDLTPSQKERKMDLIKEVMRFCINNVDCRRTQILRFFAENFSPANCNRTCDVCSSGSATMEDVTDTAAAALRMVEELGSDERVTQKMGVDRFMKSQKKDKIWTLSEVERLFELLLIEEHIGTMLIENRSGFINAYLTRAAPAKTRPILSGTQRVMMGFSNSPTGKPKAIKEKRKAPVKSTSNPIARQRSLQQIAAQEAEFDDSPWEDIGADIEPIEDGSPRPIKSGPKSRSKAVPKSASLVDINDLTEDEGEDGLAESSPEYLCLQDLKKLRESIASSEKKARSAILDDEVLELLATLLPSTQTALAKVDGMTPDKVATYGPRIIACCKKHKPATPRAAVKSRAKPMERIKSLAFTGGVSPGGGGGIRPMAISAAPPKANSVRQRKNLPTF